jgi:2-keto-4-pentenoate hydratase
MMTPQYLLEHFDQARLWSAADREPTALDLAAAYQTQLATRALRIARGERPLGYKIGFTNRTIWERYGVYAPIWGPVWDTTVRHCEGRGSIDLAGTCQPRLEPEIVFGLRATPPRDATLEQLYGCIEWLAPGFEVVHSHCADWKFSAAETVLDGALHGRLLVGARTPIAALASSGQALDDRLARTRVRLFRGTTLIEAGLGANVLDGPLHALRHFVLEMQRCPGAPALQPGEFVTTGTWTDAWPPAPGETWRSEFDAPFLGLEATFASGHSAA